MIDFSSTVNIEWFDEQIKKHPEIIRDGILLGSDINNELFQKLNEGKIKLIIPPGKPIQERDKKGKVNKVDWDAWFLYYCLMDFAGLKITYDDIGNEIGRNRETVKQNFIGIQCYLDKK